MQIFIEFDRKNIRHINFEALYQRYFQMIEVQIINVWYIIEQLLTYDDAVLWRLLIKKCIQVLIDFGRKTIRIIPGHPLLDVRVRREGGVRSAVSAADFAPRPSPSKSPALVSPHMARLAMMSKCGGLNVGGDKTNRTECFELHGQRYTQTMLGSAVHEYSAVSWPSTVWKLLRATRHTGNMFSTSSSSAQLSAVASLWCPGFGPCRSNWTRLPVEIMCEKMISSHFQKHFQVQKSDSLM